MLEERTISLTQEEICDAARSNLVSFILVAIQYLKENELDTVTFWQYVGKQFAAGWTEGDIEEVARAIALNMASCGGKLQAIHSDSVQTELIIEGWPPEEFAKFYSISLEDAAQMVEVFRPIAKSLGLSYDWKQEDNSTIKITLKK